MLPYFCVCGQCTQIWDHKKKEPQKLLFLRFFSGLQHPKAAFSSGVPCIFVWWPCRRECGVQTCSHPEFSSPLPPDPDSPVPDVMSDPYVWLSLIRTVSSKPKSPKIRK